MHGTFIIAQTGLADGRCVCVPWNVLDAFRERFPLARPVVDRLFIDEGSLITCAGSTATIDMALYLIKRHCGDDKARQALRHMMLQDVRPASLPQPHFHAELSLITDLRVRKAAHFIEQRLDDPPRVETIASYAGISVRQPERGFETALGMSPAAFQRRVRLDYAKWLPSNSDRAVTQIAFDCGFADGAHLSREFRSAFGRALAQFRRAYRLVQLSAGLASLGAQRIEFSSWCLKSRLDESRVGVLGEFDDLPGCKAEHPAVRISVVSSRFGSVVPLALNHDNVAFADEAERGDCVLASQLSS